MEENKVLIGALIFIGMVVGANFIMYAIARGAARPGGDKGFLGTMMKSLNTNQSKKSDDMEELRRTIQELNEGKKDQSGDSE
ncbi:MAG: hypothetical protein JNK32_11405 [Anaerolineales bacterium]|nr:hypothetical protein [Anaerolineales bacterium]